MPDHRFTTTGVVALHVDNAAGEVTIDSHDEPVTTVEIISPSDPAVADEVRVEHLPGDAVDRITVTAPRGGGWRGLIGGDRRIAIRIRLPHGSAITTQTASADVRARGRFGSATAASASGDVRIDQVDGALQVSTASGKVVAGSVAGPARVKTASGAVDVERLRGDGRVTTASGDVAIGWAEAGLVIKSASGEVVVRSAATGRVHTASGDVSVERAGRGFLDLLSVSGDISVGVAPGTTVTVDAESITGNLSSEIELGGGDDAAPGGSDQLLEIKARTVNGDVEIRRAAASAGALAPIT